jgi:hypothetical protein
MGCVKKNECKLKRREAEWSTGGGRYKCPVSFVLARSEANTRPSHWRQQIAITPISGDVIRGKFQRGLAQLLGDYTLVLPLLNKKRKRKRKAYHHKTGLKPWQTGRIIGQEQEHLQHSQEVSLTEAQLPEVWQRLLLVLLLSHG